MNLTEFIEKYGDRNVNEKELKKLLGIKDEKYFIPKENEVYWFVSSTGNATEWCNGNYRADISVFKNNEVFRTKEEAEEHAKKQRFLLKMKRDFLDNSDGVDWKDRNNLKFTLGYKWETDEISIFSTWQVMGHILYTTNYSWLQEYIEKHEEEIKKYYFGIEEE